MRALLFSAFLILGCQSGAAIGTVCTTSSSCASPLVCRLGRCRTECVMNRDCPIGAQCYLDANGQGACQLDVDRSCGASTCATDLMCLLGTCVRACTTPMQCPSDGECTLASGASVGVCSDLRNPIDAAVLPDAAVVADTGSQLDAASVPDAVAIPDAAEPVDAGPCTSFLSAAHVAVGEGFACAIRLDGTVVCWGGGDHNELGSTPPTPSTMCDGTACAPRPIVVDIEGAGTPLSRAIAIGAGEGFACALLDTGRVRCWGRNYQGMIGAPGGIDDQPNAYEVVDEAQELPIADATQLTVGEGHSCVLRGDGHVWCWGIDDAAQLGRGLSSTSGHLAVHATVFDALAPFERVFAMSGTTCIVQPAGDVWCAGDEAHQELGPFPDSGAPDAGLDAGDASTGDWGDLPRRIALTLATPHVVTGGGDFACAVVTGGTTQCWGWNINGAFGDGSTASEDFGIPQAMGTGSGLAFTSFSGNTTGGTMCGVAGGRFYCWGSNTDGRAGFDPMTGDVIRAREHTDLPSIVESSCGQQHCCAIDASHQVWCWGDNHWGQLGRGTTTAFEWQPDRVVCP